MTIVFSSYRKRQKIDFSKLKQRIAILQLEKEKDDLGGYKQIWKPFLTIWAYATFKSNKSNTHPLPKQYI